MTRALHSLALVTTGLALAVGGLSVVGAQDGDPASSGPTIVLEPASVAPGDRITVTLAGWTGREVILSVCGNQGRRGSMDCNLMASQGVPLNRDGSPTVVPFVITPPALPCPCVVRGSSSRNDEISNSPFELVGHPVGPVVGGSTREPLELTVTTRRASAGLVARLRTWVGGPTTYNVTVSVRNRSTERLDDVVVTGSAGRSSTDDLAILDLPSPGSLEPGQTWEADAQGEVPAPVLGRFVWAVTASGAGSSVQAVQTTQAMPVGFFIVAGVFLLDVVALVWRRVAKRRLRSHVQGAEPAASLAV